MSACTATPPSAVSLPWTEGPSVFRNVPCGAVASGPELPFLALSGKSGSGPLHTFPWPAALGADVDVGVLLVPVQLPGQRLQQRTPRPRPDSFEESLP